MSISFNSSKKTKIDLSSYRIAGYSPGAGAVRRGLWYFVNSMLFKSEILPLYGLKNGILRIFGAKIGIGVVIKPGVSIKHPWRLAVGDHSWIGEGAWIDNLVAVKIGANVCISQGAYLVTGNHDYKDPHFGLIVKEIEVEDEAWIGAKAIVCAGVRVRRGSVVTAGSVAQTDTDPFGIYCGNPAKRVRERMVREAPAS